MLWLICAHGKKNWDYHHDFLMQSENTPTAREYKKEFRRIYGLDPKNYEIRCLRVDYFPYPIY
jgi:hypothetical protein